MLAYRAFKEGLLRAPPSSTYIFYHTGIRPSKCIDVPWYHPGYNDNYPKTGVLKYEYHIISSIEVAIESLKS